MADSGSRPRATPTRPRIRRSRRPPPSSAGSPRIPYAGYLLTLYSAPSGILFVISSGWSCSCSASPSSRRPRARDARPPRPSTGGLRRAGPLPHPGRQRFVPVAVAERATAKEVVRASRERRTRAHRRWATDDPRRPVVGPEPNDASSRARSPIVVALLLAVGIPATDDPRALHGHRRSTALVRRRHAGAPDRPLRDRWHDGDPDLDAQRRHVRHRATRSIARPRAAAATRSSPAVTPGTATTSHRQPGRRHLVLRRADHVPELDQRRSATRRRAVVTATSTTFKACVSTRRPTRPAPATTTATSRTRQGPASATIGFAIDTNTGTTHAGHLRHRRRARATTKDRHRFWGFAFGLPGDRSPTSTASGSRRTSGWMRQRRRTRLCAQLSWDGGTTWTTHQDPGDRDRRRDESTCSGRRTTPGAGPGRCRS